MDKISDMTIYSSQGQLFPIAPNKKQNPVKFAEFYFYTSGSQLQAA